MQGFEKQERAFWGNELVICTGLERSCHRHHFRCAQEGIAEPYDVVFRRVRQHHASGGREMQVGPLRSYGSRQTSKS